ncbi:hypothetical protein IM816_05995 [Luteibacter flocculans]|uniref:Uncharacterized protein n=1 Tax=Luteibacter flocculans TaxID=2780091 RepID=A0ABY4T411_9GAMM|nr:hypothetical protein [Luteibacter flocculans]URL59648.1 hypothetical protein IM816_05995 [Luteibacter flocculans]
MRNAEARARADEELRQAKLHAAVMSRDFYDLMVHGTLWSRMLKEDRFELPGIYHQITQFPVEALDWTIEKINLFDYEDAAAFGLVLLSFRKIKAMARGNLAMMKEWTLTTHEVGRETLLPVLDHLVIASADGYLRCNRVAGLEADAMHPIREAEEIFKHHLSAIGRPTHR